MPKQSSTLWAQDLEATEESAKEEIVAIKKAPIASADAVGSIPPYFESGFASNPIPHTVLDHVHWEGSRPTDIQAFNQFGPIGIRRDLVGMEQVGPYQGVMANMAVPWSAFICGSQGSGKSQTLACLLETALPQNDSSIQLPSLLSGMALNYNKNFCSGSEDQFCIMATLCLAGIPVTVLTSPYNDWDGQLEGLPAGTRMPNVKPLCLYEDQLTKSRFIKLMGINVESDTNPKYARMVLDVLRQVEKEDGCFTYFGFRRRISGDVDERLEHRLALIDMMFKVRPDDPMEDVWTLYPSTLTIVDFSGPGIPSADACAIFSLCLSIFFEEQVYYGRVLVLDDMDKWLGQSREAQVLSTDLLSIISDQRKLDTRVFLSAQDPTPYVTFIDRVNATFVHHFASRVWYDVLRKHIVGATKEGQDHAGSLFDAIVKLRPGEVLLFCPEARLGNLESDGVRVSKTLNRGCAKIKIRMRFILPIQGLPANRSSQFSEGFL